MTVVNEENKKLIHKSKISVLDFYFDKINMMLWPRFTHLFDALVENIKKTHENEKEFLRSSLSKTDREKQKLLE